MFSTFTMCVTNKKLTYYRNKIKTINIAIKLPEKPEDFVHKKRDAIK